MGSILTDAFDSISARKQKAIRQTYTAHRQFEAKRKSHYNEFYAVKLARQLMEKDEELLEAESEEGAGPSSTAGPSSSSAEPTPAADSAPSTSS
ncbi:protein phosphatase inhibitor 2-like [Amphibalanus amphitrite]|uniref:protein phosphatase inhibitor 2-like n=1 Tax=Amphibalanus amphitrite TaxID=1232801 RepID=UPI001C91E15A|nr:protein phosphatase inhibitor 2-like [Amphibalanus amphitrite]